MCKCYQPDATPLEQQTYQETSVLVFLKNQQFLALGNDVDVSKCTFFILSLLFRRLSYSFLLSTIIAKYAYLFLFYLFSPFLMAHLPRNFILHQLLDTVDELLGEVEIIELLQLSVELTNTINQYLNFYSQPFLERGPSISSFCISFSGADRLSLPASLDIIILLSSFLNCPPFSRTSLLFLPNPLTERVRSHLLLTTPLVPRG